MSRVTAEQARKARRVQVSLPSQLLRSGCDPLELELRDLSFYGFKARAATAPDVGELVKLHLPQLGWVRAKISWVGTGFFGGAFATAVDVRKCIGLASPATSSARDQERGTRADPSAAASNSTIAAVQQME